MKKLLVLGMCLALVGPAMADYAFDTFDIGTVGHDLVITDLDVSGVPAGYYEGWQLNVHWCNSTGYAYSNEAEAGLYDVNATTLLIPYVGADNGASSSADIDLVWTGDFTQLYNGGDPLHLNVKQTYYDSTADWMSVSLTLLDYQAPHPAIYEFNMDTDPGWAMDPANEGNGWAYGVPQGLEFDPSSGFTGDNVIGYNLGGAYPDDMPATEYCTTGSLDFSGYTEVSLDFQRWLGVERAAYDQAMIEISTDGGNTWHEVWHNGSNYGDTIDEDEWFLCEYDISAWADGESDVQIRWGMGETDGSGSYQGWNLDDVVFRGIPEPASLLLLVIAGLALRRR